MAITTESASTRQFINTLGVQITSIDTGLTQVLRTPSNITIDFGFKTKTIEGVNGLGQKVLTGRTVSESMGMVEITFGKSNMDIIALMMNRQVEAKVADNIILPFRRKALLASVPGVPSGSLGFDITADPAGLSGTAKLGNDIPVALVQQPFATFVPATPLSFAIGAAGATKWSTDLIAARADTEIQIPYTVDTKRIGEQSIGLVSIRALIATSDESVSMLIIDYAGIDPEGTKFDPSAENSTLKASIFPLGGCDGWRIIEMARRLVC